jgi:hypothetical protein
MVMDFLCYKDLKGDASVASCNPLELDRHSSNRVPIRRRENLKFRQVVNGSFQCYNTAFAWRNQGKLRNCQGFQ